MMHARDSKARLGEAALIAGRYRCLRTLGSGGMADVFEAVDQLYGRRVALKLLRAEEGHGAGAELCRSSFESEYHALSQLEHPGVVSVLDYGVAPEGRFYTMELLEGNDLASIAPLPWRRACSILRDACSVLALLHSRRLVHRDLTARNIFCSSAGTIKLIDFGALIAMGCAQEIVGSPPCVPPEAVQRLPLDERSDLFGVGVTLYFALTGQLLFPARSFEELPVSWQLPRRPPSALIAGIPRELDALVLELTQLDADLRPRSAGEVIDRLEAIAGLEHGDRQIVSRPYLGTPDLVEREAPLKHAVQRLRASRTGQGAAVLVTGAAGSGRSRFLDACVLQAKLQGTTTLLIHPEDSHSPYAGARVLAAQLLEIEPELARSAAEPHLAVLGQLIPALLESRPIELQRFADPRAARPALQTALRAWIEAISEQQPLLLAVDDFDQLDEPSAALVSLLAADAEPHCLAVFASCERHAETSSLPLAVLQRVASVLELNELSEQATRSLLASMFGDTPRLGLLAVRVHAVADGNPRDVLELARGLVDRETIRWEAGAWALPTELHPDVLPASVPAVMRARIATLGSDALRLARLLALSQLQALTFQEFVLLCDRDASGVLRGIDELMAADLMRVEHNAHHSTRPAWRELLLADLDADTRVDMHLRLAALLAGMPAYPFRDIQHLRWAGQEDAALERLVAFCAVSSERTAADPAQFLELVERLPRDWYELLDWGIERLKAKGRSDASICVLQGRMAGILPTMNPYLGSHHTAELLARLCRDAGLDLYQQLEPSGAELQRIQTALALAQQRFDTAAEHDRVLPPQLAIRQLAQIMLPAAGCIATTYDYELWQRGPRLEPLHPIAPPLKVVSLLWSGLGERMAGRFESALRLYEQVEALLARPDRSGIDPSHATYCRLGVAWGMGVLQAMMGQQQCWAHAEELSRDPWYRCSGILVRMLHRYWQAEPDRGDEEKERWMCCLIESKSRHWFEGGHLIAELAAHALAGDLERLKALLPDVRKLAELGAGWRPIYDYALGEYQRLRGDLPRARQSFQQARTAPLGSEHQVWAHAVSSELGVLILEEQYTAAVETGEAYLQTALQRRLVHLSHYLRIPLARAYAGAGQPERATALLEEVLSAFEHTNVTGLTMGWAQETRVRVALAKGDTVSARQALEACVLHFRAAENPLGRRRCEQLAQAIRACSAALSQPSSQAPLAGELARVQDALRACSTVGDRAALTLELLLEHTGASGGRLQLLGAAGPGAAERELGPQRELSARLLESVIQDILGAEAAETDVCTVTSTLDHLPELSARIRPLILQHRDGDKPTLSGVALVLDPAGVESDAIATLTAALSRALSPE